MLSEEPGGIDEEKKKLKIEEKKTDIEGMYEENDQREMNENTTRNLIEGMSDQNEHEEEISTEEVGGMFDDLEKKLKLNDYCQERNLLEEHMKIKQNADNILRLSWRSEKTVT